MTDQEPAVDPVPVDGRHPTFVRLCAPVLQRGQLAWTRMDHSFTTDDHGRRACPVHRSEQQFMDGEITAEEYLRGPALVCLDTYWSEEHLAGLSEGELLALWHRWRSDRAKAGA